MDLFNFYKSNHEAFVSETLDYPVADFDIVKIYAEVSSLYEEITFLLAHQKKTGFFQQPHSLEEFKYDFANRCGVLYRLSGDEHSAKNVIRTLGDERILSEKKWI